MEFETIEDILSRYTRGESGVRIAEELGLKRAQVYYQLKKANLERRSNKDNSRRYSVNHGYFSDLSEEGPAYWLGFLAADGSLVESRQQKLVKLAIARRDEAHLQKFLSDLESTYPIRRYSTQTSYGLALVSVVGITSDKMFDDLERHGCCRMKSKHLTPPVDLPHESVRHYIRGFVDGDGCVAVSGTSKSGYRLKISGLKSMLDWVNSNLPRPATQIHPYKDRNSWALEAHSDNLVWLYENSTVSLGRKRDRVSSFGQL